MITKQTPAILIAGQSSGVGKTTITLGLIAALRRRGMIVQPFKCGPDYIDPTYHTLVAERPCRNLDTWMLTPEQMIAGFDRACQDADIAIIEGVMGLFDGSSYDEETGSSAQIAKLLDLPVLLVLNIGKLARSAGAMALGYQQMDTALKLAGVILNFAGSTQHAQGCAVATHAATALPTLGWLPKESQLHLPERHLGLVPTTESIPTELMTNMVTTAIEMNFDLEQLVTIAQQRPETSIRMRSVKPSVSVICRGTRPRISVARDEAFSFYYPDNLEMLEAAGAEICFFSPLRDSELPANSSALYLGGGFPELYAESLSRNRSLHSAIWAFFSIGGLIYAECGGFMLLTEALVDQSGMCWPMVGLVPGEIRMQQQLAALGYRIAVAQSDNLLLRAGEMVRGHEFHYSTWHADLDELPGYAAWAMRRRVDDDDKFAGYAQGNLLASYLHVHFAQDDALAARFVSQSQSWQD